MKVLRKSIYLNNPNQPGPGCSKLTTPLVNVSLKFLTLILQKNGVYCWENVNIFCIIDIVCRKNLIFSTKNSNILIM